MASLVNVQRISIFPLTGAILYPAMQMPLHIFEPRYRALISDALARDRLIGMVQPRGDDNPPALFNVGCLGRIEQVEALEDGRYNIVLEGLARFTIVQELSVSTAFRQVEGELWDEAEESENLSIASRGALEMESRKFAEAQGYLVDWNSVSQLDDYALVNAIAQVAPFDSAAKQALLECRGLETRSEMLIQLMEFFGRRDSDDNHVTLQ